MSKEVIVLIQRKEKESFVPSIEQIKFFLSHKIPIRVLPTNQGQFLLEKGITQVYLRGYSRNGGDKALFTVNPDPITELNASIDLRVDDLDFEEAIAKKPKKSPTEGTPPCTG